MTGLTPARLVSHVCRINENLTSPSTTVGEKKSSCLLEMTIVEPTLFDGDEGKQRNIALDLPLATLNSVVECLTEKREQLANIAKK